MMRRRFLTGAVIAAVMVLGSANRADATFQMRLTSSAGPTLIITDQDFVAGPGEAADGSAIAGAIVFNGSFGAFDIVVNTGLSKPALGSAAVPHMDLNYSVTRITAGAAETLTLEISDQGFTSSPVGMVMNYGGTTGTGSTATYVAGTGLNNALYNTSDASESLGPFAAGAFSGTDSFTVGSNGGNPYSLTLRVVLVTSGVAGTSSGDAELTAAPAPAGLILAATAVPFLGLIRRRMRKAEPTTAA